MIHRGVKKIPEDHIMKRWTREACDYHYPDDVSTSVGEQMGQSMLYANALDVVKATRKNPKAGEILNRHLRNARKEIDGLNDVSSSQMYASDGYTTTGYDSATGNETDKANHNVYDSNGQPVVTNKYGAAGSSAYMSDADVSNIQAPIITAASGRKRETRYKPMFERNRKRKKRYTGSAMINEDCDEDGEQGNTCIPIDVKGDQPKGKKTKKKQNKK